MALLTALIDGDIPIYRATCAGGHHDFGFASDAPEEETPESYSVDVPEAKKILDALIEEIMCALGANEVHFAMSDSHEDGWRRKILPTYKTNRDDKPKPPGFYEVQEYAKQKYNGVVIPQLEADDILGIWATGKNIKGERVIVSEDKDMGTIPGLWWRPRKNTGEGQDEGIITTTRRQADQAHLLQTLMGDATDGYTGIPGVGIKKAQAYLDGDCSWLGVVAAYQAHGLDQKAAVLQARVARILRHGEYSHTHGVKLWVPWEPWCSLGIKPPERHASARSPSQGQAARSAGVTAKKAGH